MEVEGVVGVERDLEAQPAPVCEALLCSGEDKTLALFSRAEPRDYIDFRALAQRFSLTELCDLAASKDGGFTPSLLADALDYIVELRRHTFDLDDASYEELIAFAESTAQELQELARVRDEPGGLSIV